MLDVTTSCLFSSAGASWTSPFFSRGAVLSSESGGELRVEEPGNTPTIRNVAEGIEARVVATDLEACKVADNALDVVVTLHRAP